MNKITKLLAAATVGVTASALMAVPAQAAWSELTRGRLGFWTRSYGDPLETGSFGAYKDPSNGGVWGAVLPYWLDNPRSIWNDTSRNVYVYENPSCMSAGGRFVGTVRPGDRINSTAGVNNWNTIQAYSFLQPTSGQRSCNGR